MSTPTIPRLPERRPHWPSPTATVRQGLPDRSGRLPPLGPQRGRRTDLHPAGDVRQRSREHPTVRAALRATACRRRGASAPDEAERMLAAHARPARPSVAARSTKADAARAMTPRPAPRRVRARSRYRRSPPSDCCAHPRRTFTRCPTGFTSSPKLAAAAGAPARHPRHAGRQIDWAHAEALAFAAILTDGTPIRLTGRTPSAAPSASATSSCTTRHRRDVTRRSQRLPRPARRSRSTTARSPKRRRRLRVWLQRPRPEALVLWEAQFGDFANGAQVHHRPVHRRRRGPSGGRNRRWCCCCRTATRGRGRSIRARDWSASCSSPPRTICGSPTARPPAQYFHLLRRQAALLAIDPRPLIVMTPKSLLRHPLAASVARRLGDGPFQPVLDDPRRGHARRR